MTQSPRHWTATLACLGPVGHLPKAPGTWGSAVAIPAAVVLMLFLSPWMMCLVAAGLVFFAVWCCGQAEKVLGAHDPGCVVLDECVAVLCCYLGPMLVFPHIAEWVRQMDQILNLKVLILHASVFALFRLFDIWKPWPVSVSQNLPKGWGVVIDDVLAAVYVNLILIAAISLI
jgi:phosphatidylglycerophosphatase A